MNGYFTSATQVYGKFRRCAFQSDVSGDQKHQVVSGGVQGQVVRGLKLVATHQYDPLACTCVARKTDLPLQGQFVHCAENK